MKRRVPESCPHGVGEGSANGQNRLVVTEDDVRRIALSLPSTTEKPSYGTPGFRVKDRLFARIREEGDILVLWVESEEEKQAMIATDPTKFFTTPHYDGHPMVLVRFARDRCRRTGGTDRRLVAGASTEADRASIRRRTRWRRLLGVMASLAHDSDCRRTCRSHRSRRRMGARAVARRRWFAGSTPRPGRCAHRRSPAVQGTRRFARRR